MQIEVKHKTFSVTEPVTPSYLNEQFAALYEQVGVINSYLELESFYLESGDPEMRAYLEGSDGLFTKLGKSIANMLQKIVDLIRRVCGGNKVSDWDKLTNYDKVEKICEKYPAFKDQIMVAVTTGALDMNTVRDMNSFLDQFDALSKKLETEQPSGLVGKAAAFFKSFNDSKMSSLLKEGTESMNTVTNAHKALNKTGEMCTDWMKKCEYWASKLDAQKTAAHANSALNGTSHMSSADIDLSFGSVFSEADEGDKKEENKEDQNQVEVNENGIFQKIKSWLAGILLKVVDALSFVHNAIIPMKKKISADALALAKAIEDKGFNQTVKDLKSGKLAIGSCKVENGKVIIDLRKNTEWEDKKSDDGNDNKKN